MFGLDPRAVELLTAQLSLWFAIVFVTSPSPNKLQPVWLWVAWCLAAGLTKAVGVLTTLRAEGPPLWTRHARIAGCFLGVGFWATLAAFLFALTRGQSIVWGGYFLVACAQAWALFRLFRGPVARGRSV